MTKLLRTFSFLVFLPCIQAAPLSGTKSVGPSGDYPSLTSAIANVQVQTLSGPLVLELQPAYVSTVETFPLTFSNLTTTATNTLTVRPQTGATGLVITSADTTAATVVLNGAQFVTFDGRPGGVGSNAGSGGGAVAQLTIANTSMLNYIDGVALRFINEASSNRLLYTKLQSANASLNRKGGTVIFWTTTGVNGNDNNTLDHCDLGDGVNSPRNCIYAWGSTDTPAQFNSGNTVSNCNIFNFQAITLNDAAGVLLDDGNTDWTITGNSFYQTAPRAAVTASLQAIRIYSPSGNNFTIANNFIGGSGPNTSGASWTATSTTTHRNQFQGIMLGVGSQIPSNVQGNTIANVTWYSYPNSNTGPILWAGIYVSQGSVNIGTSAGNTIGSGSGTGSITSTASGATGVCCGIYSESAGTLDIANNTIGSITVQATATHTSSLYGIQVTKGTNTIRNNIVGSTTTTNSLNAATSSTSTSPSAGQQVTGILCSSSDGASIMGNTVDNLNNNYVGTSANGQIRGIVTSAGPNTITSNIVRNLSTTSRNQQTIINHSVYGIIATGQTVAQNIVHSLANTATEAVNVTGIYVSGQSGSTSFIAQNLVHSLAVSSTNALSVVNGMLLGAGDYTAQNNMVRVGLDSAGTSTAGASTVRGIYETNSGIVRNFYHNSVYLGGTQTSGGSHTHAFISSGNSSRIFQNNIFVNARSNSGGTGRHYAVQYVGTTVNPSNLKSGGNIFLAGGTGGVLGLYNSADRTTLAAWQAATGLDLTSAVTDPLFVYPTGTAGTVDLHLQPGNPAEGSGIPIAAVTTDFDGQTRSGLTPVDIGANAGNFSLSSDVFAPAISYPLLTSGSTANRVLTDWATITDNSGSVSGGANAPRLYYKKSTDADVFGGNTSASNGWKYVTATGSGPHSFTLDYSIINGGSVSVGDTVQYFVVAQDAANNFASSPAFASGSANPLVQNVNGHGTVNSFSILPGISGTKTVGNDGDYTSLTSAGGLFAAINGAVPVGNIVVKITSDLIETSAVVLNEFSSNESPSSNPYTLTIQPDSAVMRTISPSGGNAQQGLITLNGADGVTIDGSFRGIGRYLTFRRPLDFVGTGRAAIFFLTDASRNTVRGCVVEGATNNTGLGVIVFSTGAVTGNDNNLITNCQVRDLSIVAGVPTNLIGSVGSSAAVANSGNTISNNDLFNFKFYGIYIGPTGNDSWMLSGNNIYEVNAATGNNVGIQMQGGGTNVITDNFIHDLRTTNTTSHGIYFSGTSTTIIARNRITALNVNSATTFVVGIRTEGSSGSMLNVENNQITLSPAEASFSGIYGLYDGGAPGSVVNAYYNSVVIGGIGTGSSAIKSYASLRESATTHTSRNNIFLNLRTGTGNHFAAGREIMGGNVTGGYYIASNNVYAGTGTTAANFMDYSTTAGTTVPVSFSEWQSSTGDTNSQAGIAGSGNFTATVFVNTATGDLHLVPDGNPLVNALGIPISSVTNDYDGTLRSATTPTIGSDEYIPNTLNPTFSGYTLKAKKNTPVSVGKTKLLGRAADADGGVLAINGVGALSAQGGSVVLGASSVGYSPPVNFTGLDTFGLTIIDGQGGSVVGTVTVNVSDGNAVGSGNEPQITVQPGGSVALLFQAIPGQSYRVERSTDLQAWTLLETVTAASDGTLPCVDPDPPVGSAFYRLVVP